MENRHFLNILNLIEKLGRTFMELAPVARTVYSIWKPEEILIEEDRES